MKHYILDTSVAVKWFVADEIDTTRALILRDQLLNNECKITIPDLLVYELANALRYNPYFTRDDTLAAVNSIFLMGLIIKQINGLITTKAIDLAHKLEITVYDSYFLAMSEAEKADLITADEKFYKQAEGHEKVMRLKDFA